MTKETDEAIERARAIDSELERTPLAVLGKVFTWALVVVSIALVTYVVVRGVRCCIACGDLEVAEESWGSCTCFESTPRPTRRVKP